MILRCLEKDPHQRYQNVQLLISELHSLDNKTSVQPTGEPSIIVLPFDDISPDKDNEYFSDGLTEEIISDLSQIRSLRVISRTSSMILKGTQKSINQIGKELNVKYVLEGSVRKAGNNVRITAQLIDADNDTHLWAEKYNGTLDNVFDLQEKVSLEIQAALKLSVGGDEQKGLEKRYTDNFKAYDLYLKGLHLRRRLKGGDIRESIEYFKQAIEIDPDYALAYAGISYAYMLLSFYTPVKYSDVHPAGKSAVQKALALDDQLPEAYEALLAISAYCEWNWEEGKKAGRKIVELNPSYPWGYHHLSMVLAIQGQVEESIRLMHKAYHLDPLNMAFNRNLGYLYLVAGQLDTAIEIAKRTIEMDSQMPGAYLYLAKAYLANRKYEEALTAIDKEQMMPQEIIEPVRGIIYTHMDRKEEASRILEKYIERAEDEFTSFYSLATLCIALGKNEQALDLLEKGYENHDVELQRIKTDFLLDSLRTEARFKAILKKMKLD
jgi:TolB-like protein/Flp pilus assembly protein TadD